ncbi:ABC transporter substrate-binding protein [Thermosediminibacter oceani]|uniref:Periplasmic binding protein n=1 Tax=Thermosediminibacter oceani (strain ATCC BAA-1034 / DSM 16646 / JW/IW-1228P) TaxID=555079 RepID=D9RXV5_THEOJ|nr:cobalamin-binding protein [Thermosediminibacter oceani]ADL08179.1 periplasmic binding protein [Thermosediminibacter oceani DSM 16646]
MKLKFKRIIPAILIVVILASLTACGAKNQADPNHNDQNTYPVKIKDQMGREVVIEKEPERIVSLAPSNTEILFALSLGDKVVGVTDYCDYPEEAKKKEKIGGFADPNMEKVISLKPDLVIATSMHEKPVTKLEELNIPVIVLNPKNIDEIFGAIELIGRATNKVQQAEELVSGLKNRIKAVEDRVSSIPTDKRPQVFYELWHSPITTAGPGTFVHDLIEKAGGRNIAADAEKEYPEYSQEMVIAKNPDIIIYSYHGNNGQSSEQDISNRPGWKNIKAVKEGKVFYVDEDILQLPTPRLVDGLEQLAKIIHPEIFKD